MKRNLFASLVGIVLVVATACAPAAAPGAVQQPDQKPNVPQTMVWGAAVEMPTLHPFVTAAGTQRRYDIYDLLIALDSAGKPGPMLATSWKLLDEKTWEFTIRSDVKFHDGTPLTSEDVAYSYNIAKDPNKKYSITTRAKTIASAEAVNATTVRIKTLDPDPIFLRRAALITVLPKAHLEKVGDDLFGQKPVGSGPFKVREFVVNSHLILDGVMEHPFRKPTLTQVTVRFIPDAAARSAGLRTGELDFVDSFPVESMPQIQAMGLKTVSIDSGTSKGYWVDTVLNDGPTPEVTRDKRVRQAINYAIDKDLIVKNIYFGLTKVEQCQVIQPETFGFNPNLKPYPYDPAKARQLLQAAGATGAKVQMDLLKSSSQGEPIALFVQDQLKAVGLDAQINVLGDYAVFRDKFYGIQPRSALFPPGLNNQPLMDADGALTWFDSTQLGGARHYDNPDFQRYYKAASIEMDETKRRDLIWKALEVFCEDPPYLFLVQDLKIWAYRPVLDGLDKRVDREPRLDGIKRIG
ncbi:MAG: ABC transporter substrate-binding protein [Dehalococcoidia bacterium]